MNNLKSNLVRNTPSKPILLPFSYLKFAPIRVKDRKRTRKQKSINKKASKYIQTCDIQTIENRVNPLWLTPQQSRHFSVAAKWENDKQSRHQFCSILNGKGKTNGKP